MSLWTLVQVSAISHRLIRTSLAYKHAMHRVVQSPLLQIMLLPIVLRGACELQACILFANATAILNNDRFLEKCALQFFGGYNARLFCKIMHPPRTEALCGSQMAGGSASFKGGIP